MEPCTSPHHDKPHAGAQARGHHPQLPVLCHHPTPPAPPPLAKCTIHFRPASCPVGNERARVPAFGPSLSLTSTRTSIGEEEGGVRPLEAAARERIKTDRCAVGGPGSGHGEETAGSRGDRTKQRRIGNFVYRLR